MLKLRDKIVDVFVNVFYNIMFKKLRTFILASLVFCGVFIVLYGIYCPVEFCFSRNKIYDKFAQFYGQVAFKPHSYLSNYFETFDQRDIRSSVNLDLNNEDVLVFLHIQKTGGTLIEKNLVKYGILDYPCSCQKKVKKCRCHNSDGNNWLFSRYSTGWSCGLHADWTELMDCVEKKLDQIDKQKRPRKLYYFTMLRDPMDRYVSEWRHVQRGSTWGGAKLKCNGRTPTQEEWPFCYDEHWDDVPLKEFISCRYNLANNRQTRMLANLSLVHCYNISAMSPEVRDRTLLMSAKSNLRDMAYVGLADQITYTQYLFHRTFGLTFREIFLPHNVTHSKLTSLTDEQRQAVANVNRLDLEFYDFAKQLFYTRLRYMIEHDEDISDEIKQRVIDGPHQATWFTDDAVSWLTEELRRVLYLHGSRLPSPEVLQQRQRHWQRKLADEMPEYDDAIHAKRKESRENSSVDISKQNLPFKRGKYPTKDAEKKKFSESESHKEDVYSNNGDTSISNSNNND